MSGWEQSSTKQNLPCAVRSPGGVVHAGMCGFIFSTSDFCHTFSCRPARKPLPAKISENSGNHPKGNVRMPISMDAFNSLMSNCTLCPRQCHADRLSGETGYCGQTAELTAARAALHYWEEPCISGTAGSGAVFFSGCNMQCVLRSLINI